MELAGQSKTDQCASLKTFNNLVNGQITWRERELAEGRYRSRRWRLSSPSYPSPLVNPAARSPGCLHTARSPDHFSRKSTFTCAVTVIFCGVNSAVGADTAASACIARAAIIGTGIPVG